MVAADEKKREKQKIQTKAYGTRVVADNQYSNSDIGEQ